MDPVEMILKNFVWCEEYAENSFTGILHERHVWDVEKYWEFEEALYQLAERPDDFTSLMWPLFRIFSHTMLSFGTHFDPNDLFRIENFSDEQVYEFRERFQFVFEALFSGEVMPKQSQCFDSVNPRLKEDPAE